MEAVSEERHEFRDGNLLPMTGGTPNHSRLCRRIISLLDRLLRGTEFEPFDGNLRVFMPQPQKGAYPDAFVVRKPLQLNPDCDREVLNPSLIIEVLSDSTEAYDRGKKFAYYRTIPSFCEYILISQEEVFITQYIKAEKDEWRLRFYTNLSDRLHLETIQQSIAVADLYEDVEF